MSRRWVREPLLEKYEYVTWGGHGKLADWLNRQAEMGFRLVNLSQGQTYEDPDYTVVMERRLTLEITVGGQEAEVEAG